jgi:cell division septation protein DedD
MVSQYIKELLQESDEVIVQDLGTFQTSYHSAEIHPATHAFTPPSKNINFNTKLKMSNFLLENYIAQKENIPVDTAKEEVQKFVSSLKVNLGIEKRIPFDILGDMVLQVSDELEFKQDKQINLLNDSFGLPEIYAKPIERGNFTQKNNTPNNTQKKAINTKTPVEEPKSTWGTIAAIGSLAFVVLAVIYVVAVDSSLNPFHSLLGNSKKENDKKEDGQKIEENITKSTPEEKKTEENTKPEENTTITPEEKKPEENTTTTPDEKKVEEKKQVDTPKGDGILVSGKEGKYFIVIGGFANQANAYKKANEGKSKGLDNMKVVPPFDNKNLYRVAVGGFSTKEQAEAKLEEVKGTFGVDAWVLKY